MDKIVIIGSSGAGKTTLARDLGDRLGMKVYHLDRFFWQRGWVGKTRETRIDILQGLVWEKQWLIEGAYLRLSELHLTMADTIIFLDISPFVCLQHLIKRHLESRGRSRRDIPEGCTDKLTLLRMVKVLTFRFHGRRGIKQELSNYAPEKIAWLRSTEEVEAFLKQPEQYMNDKKNSFCCRTPVLSKESICEEDLIFQGL